MMRRRYQKILFFFARMLLGLIGWELILPKIGLRKLSRRTRSQRLKEIGASFRKMALQMGGVMIKVGQFLSARLDVLPKEFTDELTGLQDEVGPVAVEEIRAVIEQELKMSVEEAFLSFSPRPLASASIGQVHEAAILNPAADDEDPQTIHVVVKVQRPNIEELVKTDLKALRVVGGWIQRYPPVLKRMDVSALLEEFSQSLYEEMDYLHEGRNAETFAENFKSDPGVRVPKVFWPKTTRRVLVLEDLQAIKITDYAGIEAAGISREEVANRLFNTYLKQIFEDHFFHADPHPGNLFVKPLHSGEEKDPQWQLVFVDFGMVGSISPHSFKALREILLAVGTQDAARLIQAYKMLDILLPGADLELLERASSKVFEKFWGKTAPELMELHQEEAVEFVDEFGELIYDMPFQVPEDLVLLARCLGILSGICTGLYKEFNVFTNITPYTQRMIEEEGGSAFKVLLKETVSTVQHMVALPRKLDNLMDRLDQGKVEVRSPEIKHQLARIERAIQMLAGFLLVSVLFFGGVQFFLHQDFQPAILVWCLAVIGFLVMMFRR